MAEHERAKEPLPTRPPRPHPQVVQDQEQTAIRMLAERAAISFLRDVAELVAVHPHPNGPTLRLTVTVIHGGQHMGGVDVDTTNLWDLGNLAGRRSATPVGQPTGDRPARRLRVVREAS